MCGIVGILGRSDVTTRLVDGVKWLEYRGYDSAGIAVVNGEDVDVRRAGGKLKNLTSALASDAPEGWVGIGRTRSRLSSRDNHKLDRARGRCHPRTSRLPRNRGRLHQSLYWPTHGADVDRPRNLSKSVTAE